MLSASTLRYIPPTHDHPAAGFDRLARRAPERSATCAIADVRWSLLEKDKGRNAYREAHIPGAVFIDMDADLASPRGQGPGRHPLPSPEKFAAGMSRAGVGPDTHVVAYDFGDGSTAARLWWLLRYFGHERVSLLDGGIARWNAEGRPTRERVPSQAPQALVRRDTSPRDAGRRRRGRTPAARPGHAAARRPRGGALRGQGRADRPGRRPHSRARRTIPFRPTCARRRTRAFSSPRNCARSSSGSARTGPTASSATAAAGSTRARISSRFSWRDSTTGCSTRARGATGAAYRPGR